MSSVTGNQREPEGGARLLIDLGPLLVFFLVNFFAPVPGALKIFVATGAFMKQACSVRTVPGRKIETRVDQVSANFVSAPILVARGQ